MRLAIVNAMFAYDVKNQHTETYIFYRKNRRIPSNAGYGRDNMRFYDGCLVAVRALECRVKKKMLIRKHDFSY